MNVFRKRRRPLMHDQSYGRNASRMISAADFGYILEAARVETYNPIPGYYVDFMGVKTRVDMIPWAEGPLRQMNLQSDMKPQLPIPDDGYRSGVEEYVGLVHSVNACTSPNFFVVELGAGQAPWVVSGLTYARRLGLKARGIAVEANSARCDWAVKLSEDNELTAQKMSIMRKNSLIEIIRKNKSDVLVLQNAIWTSSKWLKFPQIDDRDMGARPELGRSSKRTVKDYRGNSLPTENVYGIGLGHILDAIPIIDLLHVDLQGSEFVILEKFIDALEKKVKFIGLGTHSRYIEGNFQEMLLLRNWSLLIDQPSESNFLGARPSLEGFTLKDGYQFWANNNFT
jgi:hypothetical protein